jgi:diguanylate cyclase (GGDEF)-like protein/PAS domain S-box-containing protein
MSGSGISVVTEAGRDADGVADARITDRVYLAICRIVAGHGVTFDHYQRDAVMSRVRHRMHARGIANLADYRAALAGDADEVSTLIREITRPQGQLFRDAVVLEALRAVLLMRVRETDCPRIWVPGCGDGEDVFTVAMTAADTFMAMHEDAEFVVFGSDRDVDLLRAAQSGVFSAALAMRIPSHLCSRYLRRASDDPRVDLELRRRCLFLVQDAVAGAPPFLDLDLIVARNLVTNLQPALQRQALENLHAALRPRGMLLVGSLGAQLDHEDLFHLVQFAPGLYQRVERRTAASRRSLVRQGEPFAEIFRDAGTPMLLLDAGFAVTAVNTSASVLLDESPDDILGVDILDLIEPADRDRLAAVLTTLPGERRARIELAFACGQDVALMLAYVQNRVLAELNASGDSRLRHRATEQARRAEALLRTVKDGVIVVDGNGAVVELNEQAERLTGWTRHEALRRPLQEVFRLSAPVREAAEGGHPTWVSVSLRDGMAEDAGELMLLHRDGRRIAISVRSAAVAEDDSRMFVFEDISERKLLAEELAYRASHDSVTGLFNRAEFEARALEAHMQLRRDGGSAVLGYIDVDQFKVINDTLGHVAGDELLHELAAQLRIHLGDEAFARLGGDEFGVLIPGHDLRSVRPLIDTLLDTARRFRFYWAGQGYAVTVSIGVSALDANMESITRAMSLADAACFAAKDAGRDRACYADENEDLPRRYADMNLVGKLGRALDEERFTLYFEDVVTLEMPLRPVYRELLVRVRDDDGHLIPPGAFIQAAERFHLMGAVDRWVVRHAFRSIAKLPQDDIIYALNLSGQSLGDENFLSYVLGELKSSAVDPRRICFEITETAAVSRLAEAMRFIGRITEVGCRFALDDFGAGMASFSYLRKFRAEYLKIDGSFVRSMLINSSDLGVVQTINRLGHEAGLRTIAEHVEDRELLEPLRAMGVDWAQGRAIAVARPFTELCGE